jgi:5-methyltetrahydrofolate--homocysteine methyltransferase
MRDFLKAIENRILVHDGSKGYVLQKLGLKGGECGEYWNLTNQDAVRNVYKAYLEAGSDVIQTNTFQGNRANLHKYSLEEKTYEINYRGTKLAREVAGDDVFVSASIGSTGMLFEPSGELNFDKAYEIYKEQVKAVADGGADIINFETFTDLAEMRAALLAAKEHSELPVICSMAFENGGRTLMGTEPFVAVTVLKSLGADLVGTNCSFGPEHMVGIVKAMYEAGGGYLSVKPNAGLPQVIGDNVIYSETAGHFAELAAEFVKYGARLIGGCCGSTPDFIKALKIRVSGLLPVPAGEWNRNAITSNVRYMEVSQLDWKNTGKLDASGDVGLSDALRENDLSYIEDTALDLASEGYDAVLIDIDAANGGTELLMNVVDRVQWYVRDPLILSTQNPEALEKALRIYRGVAGVISCKAASSKQAELKAVAAKYGSVILEPPILE